MDVITKSVEAAVEPVESENPNGEFLAILTNETLDRDDENLWADEWKQPLPARIHIDGDHGRNIDKTVGSAVPCLEGNRMIGKGTYAGTPYAQMVRQLVNEGHINSLSVTYTETKNQKDGKPQRELLNAAFVAIPANPEAVVLSSKSAKSEKAEGGLSASGNSPQVPKHDEMVQAMHDAAVHLGAQCLNAADADPGAADGANKSATGFQWDGQPVTRVNDKETSSPNGAGSPKESPDDSPADVATKAAAPQAPAEVPTEAADDSADDTAARERWSLNAKALEYLISKNIMKE